MAYQRIVVAVGADADDKKLLRRVAGIAKADDTRIDLLHVAAHPVTAYGDDSAHHVAPVRQLREQRYAAIKAVANEFGIPPNRVHIEFGDTIETLEQFVAGHGCELLVIGNHIGGLSGNIGRLASGLLKECRCDVLVVTL